MGRAVVFTSRLRFVGWMLFSLRNVLPRFEMFALFKPVCQGSRLGPSWIHIIESRRTPVVQWCPSGRRLVAQSQSSGFPHNFERLTAHPRTAFRIIINVCWQCLTDTLGQLRYNEVVQEGGNLPKPSAT